MSEQHKKVSRTVNYFKDFFFFSVFMLAVSGCVSTSAFTSLVGVPMSIESSAVMLKICVITAGIKKYKSIIKK